MRTSEISLDVVKGYLRIDGDSEDILMNAILDASVEYALSYTGLTIEEMDGYGDIPIAILALCAEMYDVRQATVPTVHENPTIFQILGSHSKNLI